MQRLALLIQYNGTNYHGFQWQSNALTIQEELEKAINRFSGERVRVAAASRTDAGVHACGQVISFLTHTSYPPSTYVKALNYYLPEDIVVKEAFLVPLDFNVRRAVSRQYSYFIHNSPIPSPFSGRFAYFIPKPLDIEAMNQACQWLIGEKDLASFTPVKGIKNTIRTVYRATVRKIKDLVCFSISANSFLPHQVRHTIGALVKVGLGKMKVGDFVQLLEERKPALANPALPPCGLFLMKVNYQPPLFYNV